MEANCESVRFARCDAGFAAGLHGKLLDESTQQNAAMVEQAAAAASTLASQARSLTESVQVFKLGSSQAAVARAAPGNARRFARR